MICFGDVSEQFGNITETLRTLFSVVNGDIIFDTFRSIDFAGIGGQLYIYIYILLFTYGTVLSLLFVFFNYVLLVFFSCSDDDYCYCGRSFF
jgi:hypothetical protein